MKRFGSIEAMENYVLSLPVYGDEIRKIDAEHFMLQVYPSAGPVHSRLAELAERRRNFVVAALTEDEERAAAQPPGGRPLGELEVSAVERAEARLKARMKTTRRGERAKDK